MKVFSLPGLHAKVVVAGPRAIVGSSNWSKRSEDDLIEASLDTDDPAMVKAAAAFVRKQAKGAVQVDGAFLERMPAAEPRTNTAGGGEKPSPDAPAKAVAPGHMAARRSQGVPGEDQGQDGDAGGGDGRRHAGLDAVGPGREGRHRLGRGDRIVMIWHEDKEPVLVYPPVQIMDVVAEDIDHSIIYKGTSNHYERGIPWKKFKRLADKIGLPEKANPLSKRRLDSAMANELLARWPKK